MKKILYILVAIFFVFVFQVTVKAETYNGPGGGTFEYKYTLQDTSRIGYVVECYSHYPFAFVKETPASGWYRLVTIAEKENTLYVGYLSMTNGSYTLDMYAPYPAVNTISNSEQLQVSRTDGTKVSHNWSIAQPENAIGDYPLYDTYEEAYEALTYVEPTYYYDATLDSPEFKVFILELPDFLGLPSDETNYFGINFGNPDSRYKLDVFYRTICPDDIQIGLNNGKLTFQPLQYATSVWNSAYHDFAINVNDNLNDDDFWWLAPVTSEIEFSTNVPSWQSNPNNSAYVNAQDSWNDHYKFCMPLYGNRIEICARYYYEDGNDVYVGPWTQWINTYPNTYNEQVPANYVSGDYLPGIQGVDNNTDLPTNVIDSGEVTGPVSTTSITINQNVPNYPDYPTAASYNHDNVLLQWIQTSLKLPGMIGQFSAFLTSAFTFIPSSFWTIVGFGLMCCIAIMIVKVL